VDPIKITILIAEIEAQLSRITTICQTVEARAALLETQQITACEHSIISSGMHMLRRSIFRA